MYINKMGIELEGAWVGKRRENPFKSKVRIKHDGSVNFYQEEGIFLHYGEVVSDPLDPDTLKSFAAEHCPTHVNDSCGTHVHVSTKNNSLYGCLLTPSFAKQMIRSLTDYNETVIKNLCPETYMRFQKRLNGENRFCLKEFKGLAQVQETGKGSVRYQQLNYCHRLRGTLEIRVLPATTKPEILHGLIDVIVSTINDWCSKEHRASKVRFRRA